MKLRLPKMPLLEIRQLAPQVRLGLWRIEEGGDGTHRQRERQAVEQLLLAMTGDDSLIIEHEPSGKPTLHLRTSTLSISHTKGYAALLLSECCQLGVDIEYRSDRVERIASRFIHPDEEVNTTDEKLLVWSAKETVYKLFSEDNLMFFDMRTQAIEPGCLQMKNMKRDIVVEVRYEFTDDYVLTYAFLPA